MTELDIPPWQQPETVPATTELLDESPFAAGVGTTLLTESSFGAELDVASETTGVAAEDEVPGYGHVRVGVESGPETADVGSPGETGGARELHHPEHLFGTQDLPESEELFEAEEFARHAVYQTSSDEAIGTEALAATELPARPATARPPILTTSELRNAWHAYECAEHRMVHLLLFGRWNTPVNPVTVDAWRALERALTSTGYQVHRAWVYNCRDIRGQHTRSLHAYGLAIDIDDSRPICNVNRATPDRREVRFSAAPTKEERCHDVRRGVADTSFTPEQVEAVEAIQTVDGQQVFAWGGRWRTTKDTMHFQINVTPTQLGRGIRLNAATSQATFGLSPGMMNAASPVVTAPGLTSTTAEGQQVPRAALNYNVPGVVPVIAQPSNWTCWATVATMMVSWRDQSSYTIQHVMDLAGPTYRIMFDHNQALSSVQKVPFLASLGLQAEPPMSYSVGGMLGLLERRGPLWVTTDEDPTANFAIHARVVTGIYGDGSPGGTFLRINDPAGGRQPTESFRVFMQKFEEVAAGDLAAGGKFRIQVVHF